MPTVLDVFNSDAFTEIELTKAVNLIDFTPGRLRALGIFEERGIPTTAAMIEEDSDTLSLIQTTPRGAPPSIQSTGRRKVRTLQTVHLERAGTIYADSIQNVRGFGTDALQSWQAEVSRIQGKLGRNLNATLENHLLGAIRGEVVDADGSTLYNLFTEFEVSQLDTVNFNLKGSNVEIRKTCQALRRSMAAELGALGAARFPIHAVCGDEFFDALVGQEEVTAAYDRWQMGSALREDHTYDTFYYAGVMFENYRGSDDGATIAVASQTAHFFPVVRDLFEVYFGPADYISAVNTIGLPLYSRLERDPADKWVRVHTQSNPLVICLRPRVLITGNMGGTVKK